MLRGIKLERWVKNASEDADTRVTLGLLTPDFRQFSVRRFTRAEF